MYLLLANAVVVIHYAFMIWVMFGALAVVRWHKLAWGHLPAVAWAIRTGGTDNLLLVAAPDTFNAFQVKPDASPKTDRP